MKVGRVLVVAVCSAVALLTVPALGNPQIHISGIIRNPGARPPFAPRPVVHRPIGGFPPFKPGTIVTLQPSQLLQPVHNFGGSPGPGRRPPLVPSIESNSIIHSPVVSTPQFRPNIQLQHPQLGPNDVVTYFESPTVTVTKSQELTGKFAEPGRPQIQQPSFQSPSGKFAEPINFQDASVHFAQPTRAQLQRPGAFAEPQVPNFQDASSKFAQPTRLRLQEQQAHIPESTKVFQETVGQFAQITGSHLDSYSGPFAEPQGSVNKFAEHTRTQLQASAGQFAEPRPGSHVAGPRRPPIQVAEPGRPQATAPEYELLLQRQQPVLIQSEEPPRTAQAQQIHQVQRPPHRQQPTQHGQASVTLQHDAARPHFPPTQTEHQRFAESPQRSQYPRRPEQQQQRQQQTQVVHATAQPQQHQVTVLPAANTQQKEVRPQPAANSPLSSASEDFSSGFPSHFIRGLPNFDFSAPISEIQAAGSNLQGFASGVPQGFPSLQSLGGFGDFPDIHSQASVQVPQQSARQVHQPAAVPTIATAESQNTVKISPKMEPHPNQQTGVHLVSESSHHPTVSLLPQGLNQQPNGPNQNQHKSQNGGSPVLGQAPQFTRLPRMNKQNDGDVLENEINDFLMEENQGNPKQFNIRSKRETSTPSPVTESGVAETTLTSEEAKDVTDKHDESDHHEDENEEYDDYDDSDMFMEDQDPNSEEEEEKQEGGATKDNAAVSQHFFPTFSPGFPPLGHSRPILFGEPTIHRPPPQQHRAPIHGFQAIRGNFNPFREGGHFQQQAAANNILGSGNFGVIRGGTFYDDDDYVENHFHPFNHHNGHGRPPYYRGPPNPRPHGGNDFFSNFRDFADINAPKSFSEYYVVYVNKNASKEDPQFTTKPKNIIEQLRLLDYEDSSTVSPKLDDESLVKTEESDSVPEKKLKSVGKRKLALMKEKLNKKSEKNTSKDYEPLLALS